MIVTMDMATGQRLDEETLDLPEPVAAQHTGPVAEERLELRQFDPKTEAPWLPSFAPPPTRAATPISALLH